MTLEVIVTNELAMPMMADGMTVTISYLGIQIARLTVNNREVDPGSAVGMDGEQDSVTLSQHPEILNKFFAAIVNGHGQLYCKDFSRRVGQVLVCQYIPVSLRRDKVEPVQQCALEDLWIKLTPITGGEISCDVKAAIHCT